MSKENITGCQFGGRTKICTELIPSFLLEKLNSNGGSKLVSNLVSTPNNSVNSKGRFNYRHTGLPVDNISKPSGIGYSDGGNAGGRTWCYFKETIPI